MSESPSLSPPPTNPGPALEQAALALRNGRAHDAERHARAVLAADPGHALAAQALGHAALMQGRAAAAIASMTAAAQANGDPACETLLARVLAAAGRGEDALAQLRRTADRRPPFPLAFLELAEQLGRANRSDEALAVLERGIALAPQALVLQVGLAGLRLDRGERAEARRLFAHLRAAAPDRHDVVVGLARLEALDGQFAAAADLYRHALALRPGDAGARIALGKCLLELGERDAGEASLRAATRGAMELTGLALTVLAATPRGRLFLRPSDAERFLREDARAVSLSPPP